MYSMASCRPSRSSNPVVFISVSLSFQDLLATPCSYHVLLSAVGIIGATVMPHSLFLGSALATQDRISAAPNDTQSLYSLGGDTLAERPCRGPWQRVAHAVTDIFRVRRVERDLDNATRHAEHENRGFAFVRAHIYHGIADVVVSLLGFAVIINSLYVSFHRLMPFLLRKTSL